MTSVLPHNIQHIEVPYIVVCEGFGDVCLVDQLLRLNEITNCGVGCPSRTGVGGDGKEYLNKYLSAISLAANNGATPILQGILVVLDADDSPKDAFNLACSALRFAEFSVPDSAFTAKSEKGIKTAVYLIPGENETGTLEHLLLRAIFETCTNGQSCTNTFLNCIGKAPTDQPNVLAKMQMSALVAASFPDNPWATPGPLLQSKKNDLVPINSPHFLHLSKFLTEFCTE